MRLISVSVGLPREVAWKGKPVTTAIFKEAVQGPILLRSLNLDGDRQADLSVHGGVDKAVYVYPTEHYDYWRSELSGQELPWGSFGENFTTTGLLEGAVHIGDRFCIGSAEVVVTQPRLPCYKLSIKFGQADRVKRFSRVRHCPRSGEPISRSSWKRKRCDPCGPVMRSSPFARNSSKYSLWLRDHEELSSLFGCDDVNSSGPQH